MKKLSVIIPVYYNEPSIGPLYERLRLVFDQMPLEYELIFVDDGSGDNSFAQLLELRKADRNIKIIKLSRNFGSHIAIYAGLNYSTGDCATVISADLQDPPEIILEMLDKWQNGNKVVLAVRKDREEPYVQRLLSNSYYRMMKRFALKNIPEGGFDCFLIDRQVIDIINALEEKNSTIMGQILWCGFKTGKVYYTRKKRQEGKSRWTLAKKIKLFIDSFIAFSYVPIRIISSMGFIVSITAFVVIIALIVNRLLNNVPIQGWTSLMVIILMLSGIQLITLGVIGEYLWRNFDETRKRPVYIVEREIGIHDENNK